MKCSTADGGSQPLDCAMIARALAVDQDQAMPEARRREVDVLLRGLAPKHQRQLSVSTSNALERFAVLEAVLHHRKLVLLLDYDGTLTPIVNDPSKALLSDRVRAILRELPKHFVTGVISGRSLGKIRTFVDVPGLFYAGSHGFDILAPSKAGYPECLDQKRFPPSPPTVNELASSSSSSAFEGNAGEEGNGAAGSGSSPSREGSTETSAHAATATATTTDGGAGGKFARVATDGNGEVSGNGGGGGGVVVDEEATAAAVAAAVAAPQGAGDVLEEVRHQVAAEYLPVMAEIRDQLIADLVGIVGSEVEDNRFSISVHYRNCARIDVPRVKEVVVNVQAKHERIRMGSGKEVFELQPDIAWDKGKAVLWLLDKLVVPMVSMAAEEAAGTEDASSSSASASANGATTSSVSGDGGGGGDGGGTNGVPGGVSAIEGTGTAATPAPAPARADSASGGAWADEEDLDEPGDAGKFFTIFIGDDKTDENAFAALNGEMGRHEGVGILVSEESRETNAAYTLRNPDEVALFLEKVVELGIEHRCSTSR